MGHYQVCSVTCASQFYVFLVLILILFLAVLNLHCCRLVPLAVVSRSYSVAAVCWLLLLWSMVSGVLRASVVAAHRVSSCSFVGSVVTAPGLQSRGSVLVTRELTCSAACGIFPDQGSNQCLLHWQGDSLLLSHHGSLHSFTLLHFFGQNCNWQVMLQLSHYVKQRLLFVKTPLLIAIAFCMLWAKQF